MLFEFMCGYCPFGEEVEDPYVIYQEILNGEVEVPEYMTACVYTIKDKSRIVEILYAEDENLSNAILEK